MNIVTWCHRVEAKVRKETRAIQDLVDFEDEEIAAGRKLPEARSLVGDIVEIAKEKVYAQETRALRHLDRLKDIAATAMKLPDKWYLVTWRPPTGATLSNFTIVESYLKRNYVLEWECALEQTGATHEDMGTGMHAHMIIRSGHYPSDFTRNTITHFGKTGIVKVGNNFSKYLKTEKDLRFAKNYIRGEKNNADKEPAVVIDKLWRVKNGLSELYQSSTDGTVQLIKATPMDWT